MLEREFATQVEHLLELFGWLWKHDEPAVRQSGKWATSFRGARGFPDYVATRDGRLVFAEIKNEKGRLTTEQVQWLTRLGNTTAEVYTWRPNDLETVKEVLR
jgi:Holliday junction resolvase